MRTLITLSLVMCTLAFEASAQTFRGLDKSPLDIAYYPDNFAHDRKEGQNALVKVIYSRPYKNNREIFGGIAPFGKVWRAGANESTEITFYQDAVVAGKSIRKGTYSLFVIPEKARWTIIFNSDLDFWGAFKYNEKNDVLRVTVESHKLEKELENFSIRFMGDQSDRATMMMGWADTFVSVPMEF